MTWLIALSFIVFLFFFCCCAPKCYFAQNFRSRTIIAGDWAFSGTNSAIATTEDDDAALMLSRHPGEEINVTLTIQMSSDTAGDALRLWFGGVDKDNCIVLELVIGDSSTAGIARVIERAAGVDSIVGDDVYLRGSNDAQVRVVYKPSGAASEVRVQFNRTLATGGSGPDEADLTLTQFQRIVTSPGGWRAGVATAEIAGTATFKNIAYSRYFMDFPDCGGGHGCILHADLFWDGGNAETTEEWETVDGSWTMGGDVLTCSSPGRLRSLVTDFSGKTRQRISSQLDQDFVADPDRVGPLPDWGIWFDAIDDDNYHQARVENRSGAFWLVIEKVTAGVPTLLQDFTLAREEGFPHRPDQLAVCTRPGLIYATTEMRDIAPFGGNSPSQENTAYARTWQVTTTLFGGQSAGLLVTAEECKFGYWRYAVAKAACDEVDPEWPCNTCAPCGDDGDVPALWKAVISGVANGTCSHCGGNNGTYFTTIGKQPSDMPFGSNFDACEYIARSDYTPGICDAATGSTTLEVAHGGSAISVFIQPSDSSPTDSINGFFRGTIDTPCDVTTLVDFPLSIDPDDITGTACDLTGATCLLTAIPGAN
jgi:hypothetical protein